MTEQPDDMTMSQIVQNSRAAWSRVWMHELLTKNLAWLNPYFPASNELLEEQDCDS